MFEIFRKRYDLESLKSYAANKNPERNNFTIAIIDNDELPIIQILKKNFSITHFFEIDSINEIQGFHIVVCDIDGVGKSFDSKYGGAIIVKEILNKYPQKYVIICSGSTFDVDYNEYFKMADSYINKDSDSSEWIDALDKAILELNEPYFLWERTRKFLKAKKVNTSVVNKLEQSYIKSFQKGDSKYLVSTINKNKYYLSNECVSFSLNFLMNFTTTIISNSIMQ